VVGQERYGPERFTHPPAAAHLPWKVGQLLDVDTAGAGGVRGESTANGTAPRWSPVTRRGRGRRRLIYRSVASRTFSHTSERVGKGAIA
jgi:hypothetical protein